MRQNLPYPCIRTLTKKLENFKFSSGIISNEVYEFLKIKIRQFDKDIYKDCMLVLDEMSITPGSFYDTSTNSFIGNVTLSDHDETKTATHALVFMLAGLGARWKQVVRYDFTGDSVNGIHFKPVLNNIILKAESIGFRVHAITSDMGPANQAMWRAYGVNVSRYSQISNSCTHPADSMRKLYFYADSPHAFKNTKAGFLRNKIITIPDNFVVKYALPSNIADSEHIKDVLTEDKDIDLKLAPKLREEYLDGSNHFQKMRVSNATRVFSREVSSALQYLNNDCPSNTRLTTAWFIDFLARWFHIMGSRNVSIALSNQIPEKRTEVTEFLNESIELFRNMKVGQDKKWKPFQSALLISTRSVLDLSDDLLNKGFTFFLPARLTQDCLENLFSIVRLKNVIPNALQFKNNLKLIRISQYMKNVRKAITKKTIDNTCPGF